MNPDDFPGSGALPPAPSREAARGLEHGDRRRRSVLAEAAARRARRGLRPGHRVTLVFLSGRLDRSLEAVRRRPLARAIAPALSADVNALRFGGLALAWAGCGFRRAWPIPAGLLVIVAGWWLAWRRSNVS